MNLQDIDASASPEVQMNENFESIELVSVYGKRHPVTTGLTWGYWGGRWGGTAITAGTLTLTNTADNYLVVLKSTGAISTSTATTNWNNTGLYSRVYKITCAGGVVTAVEDHRAGLYGVHGWEVPVTSPTFLTSIIAGSVTFTAFAGATTLLTLGGTGASSVVAIPGTLDWSTTTGALTVAGGVYIAKKLQVISDFAVNTDKFTVAASSGDTLVAGDLDVTGVLRANAINSYMYLGTNVGAANSQGIHFRTGSTKINWLLGAQVNVGDGFEITPSTAAGGSTFSNPALKILYSGVVTIPNLAGTGTRTVVADANGVLSAP